MMECTNREDLLDDDCGIHKSHKLVLEVIVVDSVEAEHIDESIVGNIVGCIVVVVEDTDSTVGVG